MLCTQNRFHLRNHFLNLEHSSLYSLEILFSTIMSNFLSLTLILTLLQPFNLSSVIYVFSHTDVFLCLFFSLFCLGKFPLTLATRLWLQQQTLELMGVWTLGASATRPLGVRNCEAPSQCAREPDHLEISSLTLSRGFTPSLQLRGEVCSDSHSSGWWS